MAAPKFKALNDSALKAYSMASDKELVNLVDGEGLDLQFKRVKRGDKPVITRTWRFTYTRPISSPKAGLRTTLILGSYPELGLGAARTAATELRGLVQRNVDPSIVREQGKAKEAAVREDKERSENGLPLRGSFKEAALEYHADRMIPGTKTTWSVQYGKTWLQRARDYLFPTIGDKKLEDLTVADIVACFKPLEASQNFETATCVREGAQQVLDFAISHEKLDRNVARDAKPRAKTHTPEHHPQIHDPKQLGQLYRELMDPVKSGRYGTRANELAQAACQMQVLLWQRPSMITGMQWSEIDLEHETGPRWTIPAKRMKLDQDRKGQGDKYNHVVPLPKKAIEILERMREINGHREHVFAVLPSKDVPMANETMIKPLRELGWGKEEINGHGFRGTAQTMCLERLGIALQTTECHLAHVPPGLGRTYNNAEFVDQRRAMLEQWVAYVERQAFGAEVVQLKRAA